MTQGVVSYCHDTTLTPQLRDPNYSRASGADLPQSRPRGRRRTLSSLGFRLGSRLIAKDTAWKLVSAQHMRHEAITTRDARPGRSTAARAAVYPRTPLLVQRYHLLSNFPKHQATKVPKTNLEVSRSFNGPVWALPCLRRKLGSLRIAALRMHDDLFAIVLTWSPVIMAHCRWADDRST